MSYCRWSSDNGLCDVYVYESCDGGCVIHVAAKRVGDDVPKCSFPKNANPSEMQKYMECINNQRKWRDKNPPQPIGLPHDGESFGFETPHECANKLIELRGIGYNVPQYAIDELIEESLAT